MESKITCGGSGFITMLYPVEGQKPLRLAYLQVLSDVPPDPADETILAEMHLKFYELWNEPVWQQLATESDLWAALYSGMRGGTITMTKVIKSMSGRMAAMPFDLRSAEIKAVDSDESVNVADAVIPKEFIVTGHTRGPVEYRDLIEVKKKGLRATDGDGAIFTYVVRVDDEAVARVPSYPSSRLEEKLTEIFRDLGPGHTVSVTGG